MPPEAGDRIAAMAAGGELDMVGDQDEERLFREESTDSNETQSGVSRRGEPSKPKEEFYQRECDRARCGFKTIWSRSPAAYTGIVDKLRLHISDKYGPESKRDRIAGGGQIDRQAFLDATRIVVIPEAEDN